MSELESTKIIIDQADSTAYHMKWKHFDGKTYHVDFEIYDITYIMHNGVTGEEDYIEYNNLEDYGISSAHKPSKDTRPKIEGSIKWDGCCNYELNEEPNDYPEDHKILKIENFLIIYLH